MDNATSGRKQMTNHVHRNFREKAAYAFLETSVNPHLPDWELTGSLSRLVERLGKDNVDQLAHRGKRKPYGEQPTLALDDSRDIWSMTAFGANRYREFLAVARKDLALVVSG
jgi:hypothetical protein